METDRTECNDLVEQFPERVVELSDLYQEWADRCFIEPWSDILERRKTEA